MNRVMKFSAEPELFASLHGVASISPAAVTATALGHSPKGNRRAYLVPGIGQTAVRSDGKLLNIWDEEIAVCCKGRGAIRRKHQTTCGLVDYSANQLQRSIRLNGIDFPSPVVLRCVNATHVKSGTCRIDVPNSSQGVVRDAGRHFQPMSRRQSVGGAIVHLYYVADGPRLHAYL